jgi:hypothetical protein
MNGDGAVRGRAGMFRPLDLGPQTSDLGLSQGGTR